MSFGVGEDSGHLYSAVCREANEDEAAPLRAKIEAERRRRLGRDKRAALAARFRNEGERPAGSFNLSTGGELLEDGRDVRLYGGGSWFVVTPAAVWFVQNNGADGDTWARNNIQTGGAGAIGWWLPRDEALDDEILEVCTLLGVDAPSLPALDAAAALPPLASAATNAVAPP